MALFIVDRIFCYMKLSTGIQFRIIVYEMKVFNRDARIINFEKS